MTMSPEKMEIRDGEVGLVLSEEEDRESNRVAPRSVDRGSSDSRTERIPSVAESGIRLTNVPIGRRELEAKLLRAVLEGRIFPTEDGVLWDLFCGSFDRFTLIASRLQGRKRVLDCGAGTGLLGTMLSFLGHEVSAVDLAEPSELMTRHSIPFQSVNLECEPLPFESESFDAVVCCQVLEHFVHSHLPAVREFRRVLRPGGICEIDVPNVASFRNRSRLLRGKNIAWDYERHYLDAKPVIYKGREFFPDRHNREFTAQELELLFARAGFREITVSAIRSRRYRTGFRRLQSAGSWVRDLVPGFRKTLLGTGIR